MALPPRPSFLHILPFWSLIGRITCRKKHGRLILSLFGYWSFINIANVLPTWQCTVPSLSIDLCVYITLHILSFEWNISRCPCTWLTDLMQNAFKKLTITTNRIWSFPGYRACFIKEKFCFCYLLIYGHFLGKKQTRRKKVIKLNCDECSYVATRSNYLKKHVEAQHLGIKYTCDLCNHSTKTNGDLNRHRKIKHGGVRYPCKQCDFVSVRLGYLKEHVMAKHEGVRYPCDQCKYAATFPGGLRRHKESRHDGRKFPCDQCDFSATTSGSLVRHKRSLHEGVKWGCDLCNASYTFALALKRHKKKIHGEISVNKNNKIEKPIRVISATERIAKRAKN